MYFVCDDGWSSLSAYGILKHSFVCVRTSPERTTDGGDPIRTGTAPSEGLRLEGGEGGKRESYLGTDVPLLSFLVTPDINKQLQALTTSLSLS